MTFAILLKSRQFRLTLMRDITMTTVSDKQAEKDAKAEALKARSAAMEAKEKELNVGKTGKGTRTFVAMTRGRSNLEIQYEGFDESQPETLPKSLSEFMDLTKVSDESVIVGYLIDGFNSAAYSNASDPISEYVESFWDDDVKTRFKATIRNYSRDAVVSIEDAVALIKPAYLKGNPAK